MTPGAASKTPRTARSASPETAEPATSPERPSTVEEAEVQVARLENELQWELPAEEKQLQAELRDCTVQDRAKELRDLLRRNASRNNKLIVELIPQAQTALAECRGHDIAARERSQVDALLAGAELKDAIAAAVQRIDGLEIEVARLPASMREAAETADARRLGELRQRRDAIPDELFVERIALSRLRIADLQGVAEQAAAAQPEALAEAQRLEALAATAKEASNLARQKYVALQNQEREARYGVGQQRIHLERTMTEVAPDGPVVRSIWQGARTA